MTLPARRPRDFSNPKAGQRAGGGGGGIECRRRLTESPYCSRVPEFRTRQRLVKVEALQFRSLQLQFLLRGALVFEAS